MELLVLGRPPAGLFCRDYHPENARSLEAFPLGRCCRRRGILFPWPSSNAKHAVVLDLSDAKRAHLALVVVKITVPGSKFYIAGPPIRYSCLRHVPGYSGYKNAV